MDERSRIIAFIVVEIPAVGQQLCLWEGCGHVVIGLFPMPISLAVAVLITAVTNFPGCLLDIFCHFISFSVQNLQKLFLVFHVACCSLPSGVLGNHTDFSRNAWLLSKALDPIKTTVSVVVSGVLNNLEANLKTVLYLSLLQMKNTVFMKYSLNSDPFIIYTLSFLRQSHIAWAVLKLIMKMMVMALNLWCSCFNLLSAKTTDMKWHVSFTRVVLGIRSMAFCILGEHSTHCVISPAPRS